METRYLKTLVVAAETGSFSRTAEILNLTQSAVSQRIKFLEEQSSTSSSSTVRQDLELTEVGCGWSTRRGRCWRRSRNCSTSCSSFAGGKRLSLACTPTFGTAFLPRVLNRFMLQNADMADLKFHLHAARCSD